MDCPKEVQMNNSMECEWFDRNHLTIENDFQLKSVEIESIDWNESKIPMYSLVRITIDRIDLIIWWTYI